MKKTLIALILSLAVLVILFGDQIAKYLASNKDRIVKRPLDDPFMAYRQEFGSYSSEEYEKERGSIRVVLAHRKGGPGLPEETDVDTLDRAFHAFVKAFDIRPSGWQLETTIIWDEFSDFFEHYGEVNPKMFGQGQLAS